MDVKCVKLQFHPGVLVSNWLNRTELNPANELRCLILDYTDRNLVGLFEPVERWLWLDCLPVGCPPRIPPNNLRHEIIWIGTRWLVGINPGLTFKLEQA